MSWQIDDNLSNFQLGKYHFKKKIGTGSSSSIWLASAGEEPFAIKYVSSQHLYYKKVKSALLQECEFFKNVSHNNLVKSYETFENRKGFFYVMGFFDSTNLFHAVKLQKQLLKNEHIFIMKQMADVVSFIHKNGYIHCDIKPDNFLLGADGHIKLVDFELMQKVSPFNKLKALLVNKKEGTPEYMSPEQVRGQMLGFSSDIYSLGLVYYYLLTGETIFEKSGLHEVLSSQLRDLPSRPATHKDFIGNFMQSDVIMKMIAKNPRERLQNLDEIQYVLSKSSH